MKRLFLIAMVASLATAKPGLYKEKEDFQYSRSSTDEGSKSGSYGAQRGNMGGNYERAHNMDGLAQHQMSGLVKQVEGELGDGSNTRTGSVFTAANSRGVYGSGHYDLSNLQGRNFQEGVSYDDSQSHSSLSAQSGYNTQASGYNAHSSGYNAHTSGYNAQSSALNGAAYSSRHSQGSRAQSGYSGDQHSGYNGVESNLQQAENLHTNNEYDYGGQEATGYFSQSTYNGQSAYDQSRSNLHSANSYGSNVQTRLSSRPFKVILRPGTRVAEPIDTQTYDSSNSHNSINTDTELLNNQNQYNSNYKPTGAKHYESSYSYRKKWEKHDTQPVTILPVAIPTANPFPKNSELYEDAQSLSAGQLYQSTGVGAQQSQSHSSDSYSGYNANVNSASSSQSHHQSAYNAQNHRSASAAASDSSASSRGNYNSGVSGDTTNQIEDLNSKPKSYHSSYSYHKSWERQGDPYVIKPASSGYDAQESQRLTAATNNQGTWSSHRYGSRYQQAHDCDENGHIRVARSFNTNQYEEQNAYQQNQYNYDQEVFSQQSQNLEDLTQTQNKWDKIEDLGQQTQNKWDKIEDLGQQTQNKWDRIEDLGQQTQNKWDKIEDLGQQTQKKWDKIEDLGQQTQNKWDQSEDLVQQTQNKWDQSEDLGQQAQNKWDQSEDLGQQAQNKWDQSEDLGQQTQNKWDQSVDLGQQTQTQWDKLEDVGQQTQSKWDNFDGQQSQLDDGQQLQNTWSQLETSGYHGVGQETQTNWDNINIPKEDVFSESVTTNNKPIRHPVDTASHKLPIGSQPQNAGDETSSINHHHTVDIKPASTAQDTSKLLKLWEKVDTIEKQTISSNKNNTEESQHSYYSQSKPFEHHQFGHNFWEPKDFNLETSTTSTVTTKRIDTSTFSTTSTTKNNKPQEGISAPSNVGRGDIEVEDSNSDNTSQLDTQEMLNEFGTQPKPDVFVGTPEDKSYKTPAEIEALSQVTVGDKTTTNSTEDFKERSFIVNTHERPKHTLSVVSSTTSRAIVGLSEINVHYQNMDQYSGNTVTVESGKSNSFDQSNLEQSVNSFGQQSENNIEDNMHKECTTLQNDSHRFNGINSTMPKVEIGAVPVQSTVNNKSIPDRPLQHPWQENRDTLVNSNTFWDKLNNSNTHMPANPWFHQLTQSPQNSSQAPNNNNNNQQPNKYNDQELNIGQQSAKFDQQNTEQQFENLGQQSENFGQTDENFGQQSEKFDQKNTEQQFENLGQQSENFGQVDENFGQQSEKFDQQNTEQQFENFGQHGENFEQINNDFGHQSANFDQQNTEQQFQNFGQQSENLGQQNEKFEQQFENIGQSDNLSQNSENIGQQSQNFEILSGNFGQQSESLDQNTDQQFESFYQQVGNEQRPLEQFETFGQQVDKFNTDDLSPVGSGQNIGTNSGRNFHSIYKEEQSEIWNKSDLVQPVQAGRDQYENFDEKANVQQTQDLQVIPVETPVVKTVVPEDRAIKTQTVEGKDLKSTSTSTDTPPETEKDNPGFWKSVGNKFVSAKDKVFSWFSSG